MYKLASAVVIISFPPICNQCDNVYYLDGDYTECAMEYQLKNKPQDSFDASDILYKAIIKELEEQKNFTP